MEIELIEIRDFVAKHHPFDVLAQKDINLLIEKIEVRYLRRDQRFPPEQAKIPCLYLMRTGAVELRDAQQTLLGKLGEGDVYVRECQDGDSRAASQHIALEDCLLYQIPCVEVKKLCALSSEFKHFIDDNVGARLQKAAQAQSDNLDSSFASMTMEVGQLIKKSPILLETTASIQQAAQLMSEKNVSSLLLTEAGKLAGIVTDRDLRRRCIAQALAVSLPVSQIMTRGVKTLRSDDLVLNSLMTMTREHINHMPVVDDGNIIGMLTASDLTRHSSNNPAFMTTQIRKAEHLSELVRILAEISNLQLMLANTNITARHTGETISCITDALTERLIHMAQDEIGPAPVPYVWVSGGSQARHEQSAHSDQDNAIIFADEATDADKAYFAALAKRVCDGLDACGFVYCPGEAMAMNPKWCQPYQKWEEYFTHWIEKPEPEALMFSCIFFDLRPVFGDFSLHEKLQAKMLSMTKNNSLFIAHMAANALKRRPPLGFFRDFVLINDGDHEDTFDIKMRGIAPIVEMARALALAEGSDRVNTVERLQSIAGSASISQERAENLCDALEFIAKLRIHHQARQIRQGIKADNYLAPDKLSKMERKHLKDAFLMIKEAQTSLEKRFAMP